MTAPVRCPGSNIYLIRDIGTLWAEFACLAPAAHSFEDVCAPKYFGMRRTNKPKAVRAEDDGLRVMDTIYVRAEDRSWMAELLVIAVPDGMDEVHTRVIRHNEFRAEDVPDDFEIKWAGVGSGWAIMTKDGQTIEKGFATAEAANLRLKSLLAQQTVLNNARQPLSQAQPQPQPAASAPEPAKPGRKPKAAAPEPAKTEAPPVEAT